MNHKFCCFGKFILEGKLNLKIVKKNRYNLNFLFFLETWSYIKRGTRSKRNLQVCYQQVFEKKSQTFTRKRDFLKLFWELFTWLSSARAILNIDLKLYWHNQLITFWSTKFWKFNSWNSNCFKLFNSLSRHFLKSTVVSSRQISLVITVLTFLKVKLFVTELPAYLIEYF